MVNDMLKFRAWDNRCNTMESWEDLLHHSDVIYSVFTNKYYSVMQYTGLKDAKGVEIYEGDIVYYDNKFNLLIEFNEDRASFIAKRIASEEMLMNFRKNMAEERLEVIGNIYEHSHLLDNN